MTAIAACRTCGTEPLHHARFCHGCGSPVNDADTHAEYGRSRFCSPMWCAILGATGRAVGGRRHYF